MQVLRRFSVDRSSVALVVRYLFVAIAAYLVDIGVFNLCYFGLSLSLVLSNLIGKICTAVFGFIGHRYITFQIKDYKLFFVEGAKFALAAALNFPVATGLFILFKTSIGNVLLAKLVADCASIGIAFLIAKFFVFKTAFRQDHVSTQRSRSL